MLEIIEACREVTGEAIPAALAARRPGDPDRLVASSAKAAGELGWRPRYGRIGEIIEHAWGWHRGHPEGY